MAIFDVPLHRWLLAEQGRILDLMNALNTKNRRKIEEGRRALEGRRKGPGRPKKPRPISREDLMRRIQYEAELRVVDVVREEMTMSTPEDFRRRLNALTKERPPYADPERRGTYKRARDRKIEQLLARLNRIRPTTPIMRPWDEKDVRDHLDWLLARHRRLLSELKAYPRDTPEYRCNVIRTEAAIEVLKWLQYSHHLTSRRLFLHRARIIAVDPGSLFATAERKDAWKLATIELMEELRARYVDTFEVEETPPELAASHEPPFADEPDTPQPTTNSPGSWFRLVFHGQSERPPLNRPHLPPPDRHRSTEGSVPL